MKENIFPQVLLYITVLALLGCSDSESDLLTQPPETHVWQVNVTAANEDIVSEDSVNTTRGAFIGGFVDRLGVLWDNGDVVYAYQGENLLGSLVPTSPSWGQVQGTLTGTLTGNFQPGDKIDLYLHGRNADFTGQDGSLKTLSSKTYAMRSVAIQSVSGNTITFENVYLAPKAAYLRFFLTDSETGERLRPHLLELIPISGGTAIQTGYYSANNISVLTSGNFVMEAQYSDGEYSSLPYVALLPNKTGNAKVAFKIKVTLENGDVYMTPIAPQTAYQPALNVGKVGTCRRAMQKTTNVNDLTVTIENPLQTQNDPVIVVKDGETTLVKDTDYSLTLNRDAQNVLQSITITGLADSTNSPFCETPYIGTRNMSLSINPISATISQWIVTDIVKSI